MKGRTKNENPARGCDSGPCSRPHPGPAQTQAPGAHGPAPQPGPGPSLPWPRPTLAGAALAAVDDRQHHRLHAATRTAQVQDPHGALGVQAVATAVTLAQQVRLLARRVAELGRARRSVPKPPAFPLLALLSKRDWGRGWARANAPRPAGQPAGKEASPPSPRSPRSPPPSLQPPPV